MISLRLSKELEEKVIALSHRSQITKSDVIREAIEKYVVSQEETDQPYLLGEDLFGKYGSGDGSLSVTYKKKVKEKLHEKMPH
jgi:predicted DNA-binding protein